MIAWSCRRCCACSSNILLLFSSSLCCVHLLVQTFCWLHLLSNLLFCLVHVKRATLTTRYVKSISRVQQVRDRHRFQFSLPTSHPLPINFAQVVTQTRNSAMCILLAGREAGEAKNWGSALLFLLLFLVPALGQEVVSDITTDTTCLRYHGSPRDLAMLEASVYETWGGTESGSPSPELAESRAAWELRSRLARMEIHLIIQPYRAGVEQVDRAQEVSASVPARGS